MCNILSNVTIFFFTCDYHLFSDIIKYCIFQLEIKIKSPILILELD